jgi:hypothetical protein
MQRPRAGKIAKTRRRKTKNRPAALGRRPQSDAALRDQLHQCRSELKEALEHQTATREVLDLISQSPTDAQPVFDAIVESAVRLCNAVFGVVWRYDGERLHYAASHNFTAEVLDQILKVSQATRPIDSGGAGDIPKVSFDLTSFYCRRNEMLRRLSRAACRHCDRLA